MPPAALSGISWGGLPLALLRRAKLQMLIGWLIDWSFRSTITTTWVLIHLRWRSKTIRKTIPKQVKRSSAIAHLNHNVKNRHQQLLAHVMRLKTKRISTNNTNQNWSFANLTPSILHACCTSRLMLQKLEDNGAQREKSSHSRQSSLWFACASPARIYFTHKLWVSYSVIAINYL